MICHPATNWGCAFTEEQLEEMRDDAAKAAAMARSEALAWYTLAALTAWRIGVCPVIVRPCSARCAPPGSWMTAIVGSSNMLALPLRAIGSFTPHITNGEWVNSCGCGQAVDTCSCGPLEQVLLPGPVGAVESVKVDGVTIDPSRYRIDDGHKLVATDPLLKWPTCQNMAAGIDQPGSFAVTYYQGSAPNDIIAFAAGTLAAEFYKACVGDKACRLPRGVTQVSRAGVSYEIDSNLFDNGMTRIPEIDAVILIYNPNRLKQQPRVRSVDAGQHRRQTWGTW